ncbi:MAG: hypothetical protein Q9M97_07880 [Candidatus Gracilibacteria bacterium]|nr:hypothetical protein [Candidatus Gracilibacteria bacterium]
MSEIEEGVQEYEDENAEKKNAKNKQKKDVSSLTTSGRKSFVEYKLSQDIDFLMKKLRNK